MVESRWSVLVTALAATWLMGGCCGASGSKKICEKYQTFAEKSDDKKFDMSVCVKSMEDNQKSVPKVYECLVKCADASDTKESMDKCAADCSKSGSSASSDTKDDNGPAPIDSISTSDVISKLNREFRSPGIKVLQEKTTSQGDWVATVAIGGSGDLDVFRISLANVKSKSEGRALMVDLEKKATGPKSGRIGKSKVLFVMCDQHRNGSGPLQPCVYSTTQVEKVAGAVASY